MTLIERLLHAIRSEVEVHGKILSDFETKIGKDDDSPRIAVVHCIIDAREYLVQVTPTDMEG